MPFGAVVKGNIEGLKKRDEIKIALAGPLVNLGIAILFIASWWIYPELYAFTDVVVAVNFCMAIINFIPAYPLDGGRILYAFLYERFGEKIADRTCVFLGMFLSLIMLALFVVVSFSVVNISLLFFSVFCLVGAMSKNKGAKYVKIFSGFNEQTLRRGIPYKRHAVSNKTSIKTIMRLLEENTVNEIVVFDGKKAIATLSQEKIACIVENGEIYSPIGKYIGSV
jgi:stage IV sporulation protein FB